MSALESTTSKDFRLQLPAESASWACREAIVNMGWEVETIEPGRLVTRRSWWGFSRDPSKIEVLLSEDGPGTTTVVLNGRIRWWGKRQLEGELNRFRNAVEVAARRSLERR